MRLAVCALSAVLLSGCSWLGGGLGTAGQSGFFGKSSQFNGNYGAQGGNFFGAQHNPCVVPSPRAPIPRGCDPASVTIGTASGGFPQQPNFGGGSFASGGFGSHAGVAGQQAAHYQPRKRLRKPKLRGSLSLGLEKSISGRALDFDDFGGNNSLLTYSPRDEGFTEGTPASGSVVDTTFTAVTEDIAIQNLSFDDIHSTPIGLKGGLEFITSPRTTFFANAGYTYAQGESANVAVVTGELQRRVTTETFTTPQATAGVVATPVSTGVSDPNITFIPNQNVANIAFDFSDQQRLDLEVGARHYFNPIVRDQGFKTLTPFVGASVGVAYHNSVSFDVTEDQVFLQRALEAGGSEGIDFFRVPNNTGSVEFFDSDWVATGQLNAGVEWQVTPKTALALESGLRFEGSRDYPNGENSDTNISIPLTVRGSYNF